MDYAWTIGDLPDPDTVLEQDWMETVGAAPTVPTNGALAYDPALSSLTGDEVLVGIIDDGIGFAHDRFRSSLSETRVEYFWAMGAEGGIQLAKPEIDHALSTRPHAHDEDLYKALGLIDYASDERQPLRHKWSHGTHMLDVAAGYEWRDPEQKALAQKRPIIAIQLPSQIVADTSGAFLDTPLEAALQRLHDVAVRAAEGIATRTGNPVSYLPLVVNFSFGVMAGPKDGAGRIETILSAFRQRYRALPGSPACEIVLPAGNGFLTRSIGRVALGGQQSVVTAPTWRVQPDDRTPSFLHIFTLAGDEGAQGIAVSVQAPGFEQPTEWSVLGKQLDGSIAGRPLVRLYHERITRGGIETEHILVAIGATALDGKPDNQCPSGEWTIHIKNLNLDMETEVELQIQRDDPISGQTLKARQSYLDDPAYQRYERISGRLAQDISNEAGPVFRQRTLNAFCGGDDVIAVGAYRYSDGAPSLYSAAGPAIGRRAPDLSAVADISPSHPGVLAAGTYSGSVFATNGTSVAAAQITRRVSNFLESDGANARNMLIQEALAHELAGPSGPHGDYKSLVVERHGSGRAPLDTGVGSRRGPLNRINSL